MYLEKLEIQGFKSFANKTTLLFPAPAKRLSPGIAAIIGPNGSGKSNVADAARWVLGEQSLKLLRGKRSEDVIFSGSDKKSRLGFAEVAISLNNEDKKTDIEYEQLVVKRRVYRDGNGEYFVNNAKVRLADVQLLLAQANFGQRTYSVIGQGMADGILAATPQERKQFFDEATGVKQYQIKREQAAHKLATTEENLAQAQALLKEITPRVRQMERQLERLKKREELEQKLTKLQVAHYGAIWQHIDQEYVKLTEQKKKASHERLALTKKITELQNKLQKLEQKQQQGEGHEKIQQEYFSAMNKKNNLFARLSETEKKLAVSTIKNDGKITVVDTEKLLSAAREQLSFLQLMQKASEREFAELKERAQKLEQRLAKLLAAEEQATSPEQEHELEQLKKTITALRGDIKNSELEIKEKEKNLESLRKAQTRTTSGLFELQHEYQKLQQELNTMASCNSTIDIELARTETRRTDVADQIEKEVSREVHAKIKHFSQTAPNQKDLWPDIASVRHELEMIGGIDPEIGSEYRETKKRYDFLSIQSADLSAALEKTKTIIKDLDAIIEREFNAAFKNIEHGFSKYFTTLFDGGHAHLILHKQSELEALNEEFVEGLTEEEIENLATTYKMGIEVTASPPNKKVNSISMLSGGERALTSIALICAIINANPSPFVMLDEVDAALDEANSERFSAILEELSKKTQFIAITHNRATMERANTLYGITMGDDGVSKLLSVDLEEAVKSIKN